MMWRVVFPNGFAEVFEGTPVVQGSVLRIGQSIISLYNLRYVEVADPDALDDASVNVITGAEEGML